MSKSSLSPLSKNQYYRACLLRHPRLRDELTRFHQEYPRLFARSVTSAPPRRGLPVWAQPLIHHQGPTAVAVVPRHTDDLPSVYGVLVTLAVWRAGYDTEILPEEHGRYAELLQIDAGAWQHAWDGLRHQWPQVPEPFLRYCQLSDVNRPPFLVPTEPYEEEAWVAQVGRAARTVKLMVPIYEETTREDVFMYWRHVPALKAFLYGRRRRERRSHYAVRLLVWDAYRNVGAFAPIAQTLKRHPATIRATYLQASRDIWGSTEAPPPTRRARLTRGLNPSTHMQTCAQCQRANTLEQMCPQAQAFARQDERAQRERPRPT